MPGSVGIVAVGAHDDGERIGDLRIKQGLAAQLFADEDGAVEMARGFGADREMFGAAADELRRGIKRQPAQARHLCGRKGRSSRASR